MRARNHLEPIFELAGLLNSSSCLKLAGPMKSALERLLLLRKLDELYFEVVREDCELNFVERILKALNISYQLESNDLRQIPRQGPVVVVANHPFGMVDGAILASIVRSVRPDFKLLANFSLNRISELRNTIIPVDPYGKADSTKGNIRPVREAIAWLKNGGALGVFPAGDVAHIEFRHREITDPDWNAAVARIIRKIKAPALPVFFGGLNSLLFQLAGLLQSRVRTALLPREFLNKRGKKVEIRIGSLISFERLEAFDNDEAMIDYLRRRTYLLKNRPHSTSDPDPASRSPSRTKHHQPIIPSLRPAIVAQEIAALPSNQMLLESDPFIMLHADAQQIGRVLQEIGRLREITFRNANEGTGKAIDLDSFDAHYVHLFLWNRDTREIVGAYRIGRADEILSRFGRRGLYTHTLFHYKTDLLDRINPALELGRSFVRPEYQKSFPPLFLLWKGIAQYVARHPQYKTLFGSVSIGNDYQPIARRFIVDCLSRRSHRHELADLVKARTPFRVKAIRGQGFSTGSPMLADIEEVSALIADIEIDRRGI